MKQRTLIGILGGTFDPIHDAHLAIVEAAAATLGLSEVRFMLSARPPHRSPPVAPVEHRWAMLQLAIAQTKQYIADDREIQRAGASYTIDSLRELRVAFPESTLCLLLGQDAFTSLPSWHQWQEIPELAHLIVMPRPGWQDSRLPEWARDRLVEAAKQLSTSPAGKILFCQAPLLETSSTTVREQLRTSKKPAVPAAVADYIQHHCLYQDQTNTMNSEQIAARVMQVLDDMKGIEIRKLDVRDMTDITDYMIIASGTSSRHVNALVDAVQDELRKDKINPFGSEGQEQGDWVLLDFTDVIVHVMKPEARVFYDLEKWWDEDMRELVAHNRK